ncbi:MAG: HlyD family efflux transporter periplasmic adaptor subunit [Halochromatium sp.]
MTLSPDAADASVRWVPGQVVANRIAELTAPIGGRLLSCSVYQGDAVDADQELLRIAPTAGAGHGAEAPPETADDAQAWVLRAPWQGLVRHVHAPVEGRLVQPQEALIELIATDGIALRFSLEEADALLLSPGDRIEARFSPQDTALTPLSIARAWPEIDPETRTRQFEANLPANLNMAVGLSAQVHISLT